MGGGQLGDQVSVEVRDTDGQVERVVHREAPLSHDQVPNPASLDSHGMP